MKQIKDPHFNEALSYFMAMRKWKKDDEFAIAMTRKLFDVSGRDLVRAIEQVKGITLNLRRVPR